MTTTHRALGFSSEPLRQAGERFAEGGDHRRAAEAFQAAFDLDPGDTELGARVALHWERASHPTMAAKVYAQLAVGYAELGHKERVARLLARVLELGPAVFVRRRVESAIRIAWRETQTSVGLAIEAHEAESRVGDALDLVELALSLGSYSAQIFERLVDAEIRRGSLHRAIEHLTRVALTLEERGRMVEYVPVAERLLSLVPDDLDTTRTLALTYLRCGRGRDALPKFRAWVAAEPDDLRALAGLAEVLAGQREDAAALGLVERWLGLARATDAGRGAIESFLARAADWWSTDHPQREKIERLRAGLDTGLRTTVHPPAPSFSSGSWMRTPEAMSDGVTRGEIET